MSDLQPSPSLVPLGRQPEGNRTDLGLTLNDISNIKGHPTLNQQQQELIQLQQRHNHHKPKGLSLSKKDNDVLSTTSVVPLKDGEFIIKLPDIDELLFTLLSTKPQRLLQHDNHKTIIHNTPITTTKLSFPYPTRARSEVISTLWFPEGLIDEILEQVHVATKFHLLSSLLHLPKLQELQLDPRQEPLQQSREELQTHQHQDQEQRQEKKRKKQITLSMEAIIQLQYAIYSTITNPYQTPNDFSNESLDYSRLIFVLTVTKRLPNLVMLFLPIDWNYNQQKIHHGGDKCLDTLGQLWGLYDIININDEATCLTQGPSSANSIIHLTSILSGTMASLKNLRELRIRSLHSWDEHISSLVKNIFPVVIPEGEKYGGDDCDGDGDNKDNYCHDLLDQNETHHHDDCHDHLDLDQNDVNNNITSAFVTTNVVEHGDDNNNDKNDNNDDQDNNNSSNTSSVSNTTTTPTTTQAPLTIRKIVFPPPLPPPCSPPLPLLTNITTLNLSQCSLRSIDLEYLAGYTAFPSVTSLILNHNCLSTEDSIIQLLIWIKSMPLLTKLELQSNSINTSGIKVLALSSLLSRLEVLTIRLDRSVSYNGVLDLLCSSHLRNNNVIQIFSIVTSQWSTDFFASLFAASPRLYNAVRINGYPLPPVTPVQFDFSQIE